MEEQPDIRRRRFLPPVAEAIVIQRNLARPGVPDAGPLMDCSCTCTGQAGAGGGSGSTAIADVRPASEK